MGRVHAVRRGNSKVGPNATPRTSAATKRQRAADGPRAAKPARRAKAKRPGLPGDAAHQLRNRLGAIVNAIYYLKLVSPPDERVREYLEILEREVRALRQVFDTAGVTHGEATIPPGSDAPS